METPNSLRINERVSIPLSELEFSAVRSQGPGGQHVNKVNSAVELRFTIASSSIPEEMKSRLFAISDRRLSSSGVIVIKSGSHRSQLRNKEEALNRLADVIRKATIRQKTRRPTKPTYGSVKRRLEHKTRRSSVKSLRGRVKNSDE